MDIKIESYIVGSRDDLLQGMKDAAIEIGVTSIKILDNFFDHNIIKVKNELISKYYNKVSINEEKKKIIKKKNQSIFLNVLKRIVKR